MSKMIFCDVYTITIHDVNIYVLRTCKYIELKLQRYLQDCGTAYKHEKVDVLLPGESSFTSCRAMALLVFHGLE